MKRKLYCVKLACITVCQWKAPSMKYFPAWHSSKLLQLTQLYAVLTFRRRIKSRLPFAGIIRRLPYFAHFQDKG